MTRFISHNYRPCLLNFYITSIFILPRLWFQHLDSPVRWRLLCENLCPQYPKASLSAYDQRSRTILSSVQHPVRLLETRSGHWVLTCSTLEIASGPPLVHYTRFNRNAFLLCLCWMRAHALMKTIHRAVIEAAIAPKRDMTCSVT
jgi:hypothetical protein